MKVSYQESSPHNSSLRPAFGRLITNKLDEQYSTEQVNTTHSHYAT